MPRVDVSEICEELELNEKQCQTLAKMIPEVCPPCTRITREKGERKKSKWQECITSRRKGKPFDPDAIRELAKEYKAGKCP
jgi:hypothetical protein